MQRFLVYMPEGSDALEFVFHRHFYEIEKNKLWVVAAAGAQTSADVCKALGIGSGKTGVVIRIDEYFGHYDTALWQKLEAWRAAL